MQSSVWLAIILLAWASAQQAGAQEEQTKKPLPAVSVRTIGPYATGGGARYSAELQPFKQVDLAFKVGGYIQEILQVPVLITVGATVLALFPLALHGGPLWEPLCYAQIGGLSVATFIELLLVPVLYALFVLDLKIVKWETKVERSYVGSTEAEE